MADWQVRLVGTAERDYAKILDQSASLFGARQARIYEMTLNSALNALHQGPDVRDSVDQGHLRAGLRSLHIARNGRRGRLVVMYRTIGPDTIEVVRILHDAMDFERHLPADDQ